MIKIVIHALPQEIDQLELTLIQLKKSSFMLEEANSKYCVEVLLNLNLVDWDNSQIPKEYFIDKFDELEILTESWALSNFVVCDEGDILGEMDVKRYSLENNIENISSFLWVDCDIIFNEPLLTNFYQANEHLKNAQDYYLITPEIGRCWDNTWDVITNKEFLNEEATHDNYFGRDPYSVRLNKDRVLEFVNQFKFASGWFTLISKKLLDLITIPKELGSYGIEDTFIMNCAYILAENKYKIAQYKIVNELVAENYRFKPSSLNNYIKIINRKDEFTKISQGNFANCIEKFEKRIKNENTL